MLWFGLTNAPASFTRLLSSMLHELNGDCLVLFLDDVLFYSKSIEEHQRHLRRLFGVLRENQLYYKSIKSEIGTKTVDFLGYSIAGTGVSNQKRFFDATMDWPTPRSIQDAQSFHGLNNYFPSLIQNYATIASPISDIVCSHAFEWHAEKELVFSELKAALTSAPVLVHPNSTDVLVVSTDTSKYAVGASLEQNGHPTSFLSHRLSERETN